MKNIRFMHTAKLAEYREKIISVQE